MTVKISIQFDKITPSLKRKLPLLQALPKRATNHWRSITPIRTGNARRNTKFDSPNTINADYPYAQRLDRGWSKQAPRGMLKPTVQWLKGELDKIIKRK